MLKKVALGFFAAGIAALIALLFSLGGGEKNASGQDIAFERAANAYFNDGEQWAGAEYLPGAKASAASPSEEFKKSAEGFGRFFSGQWDSLRVDEEDAASAGRRAK